MYIDHSLMMYLLNLTEELDEKVEMGALKKAMKARGVNQRGWRLYADYGDRLYMPVLNHAEARNFTAQAIDWIQVLQACEMDVPPPLYLSKAVTTWPLSGATAAEIPPLFLKAIWKAAVCKEYLDDEVQTFLQEDVAFLATWYFSQGGMEKSTIANSRPAGRRSGRFMKRIFACRNILNGLPGAPGSTGLSMTAILLRPSLRPWRSIGRERPWGIALPSTRMDVDWEGKGSTR